MSGEVLERREPPRRLVMSSGDPATYVVQVRRVLKGEVGPRISLQTPQDGASCGLELPDSGPALLFLGEDGGALHGSLCSGSRTAGDAEVVAALGEGRPPSPDGSGAGAVGAPDDSATSPAAATAAVASSAALLGGLVLAGRRRASRSRP